MKVIPTGATPMSPTTNTVSSTAQLDARARAIAKLNPTPLNANSIAPEDMSAVRSNTVPPQPELGTQQASEAPIEGVDEPTVETPVEPTPEKKDPLSSQYALLARKERAMRQKAQQQEQSLKTREDAIKAREAELATKDQTYQSGYIPKDRLKQATLEVLAENGIALDQVANDFLNQPAINPQVQATINELKAQIQALKSDSEASKAAQVEQQSQSYKAALKQIETDVTHLVKTDPMFETIRATRSVKDVVDLIEATYKAEGRVMSNEEAAQEVEDYLVEEAVKLAKLEKVQKRVRPTSQTTAPVATAPTPKQPQPMKTLTNATSSTRKLSPRERAVAAFEGKLK